MAAISERPVPKVSEPGDTRLQTNLRQLRQQRGLTLDALAGRSLVSRAMISKIERGAAIPTATVLGKLAAALEIGLSQLVGNAQPRKPTVMPRARQAVYRDPESGLERSSLSPVFPDRSVDFAMNVLPARARVVFPGHHHGVEEYLFVRRGKLTVVTDGERYQLNEGDTLFYPAHGVHEFHNETGRPAEFFIIVDDTRTR
jgi:transcriptional regulator with XRE-family HTH domain